MKPHQIGTHHNCGGIVWAITKNTAMCGACGSTKGELDTKLSDREIVGMVESALGRKLGKIVALGTSEDEI